MLVAQLCPTLWDSMHCSLPGSSLPRILQARILEWVAIPFSRGSSQLRDQTQVSCITGGFFTVWPAGKPSESYLNPTTSHQVTLNELLNFCRLYLFSPHFHITIVFSSWDAADSDNVNKVFSAVPGKLYIIYKLDNQYMIIILLPLLQGKFSVYFIYISSQVMKYNFLGYFCATITSSTLGMGAC